MQACRVYRITRGTRTTANLGELEGDGEAAPGHYRPNLLPVIPVEGLACLQLLGVPFTVSKRNKVWLDLSILTAALAVRGNAEHSIGNPVPGLTMPRAPATACPSSMVVGCPTHPPSTIRHPPSITAAPVRAIAITSELRLFCPQGLCPTPPG